MEYLFRLLAGGIVVSTFAVLGDVLRPKSFAGLFGAAPSVEQFAVNARRAPKWVLDTHPSDQRAQLCLHRRPPSPSTRFPTPVAPKSGPVTTHERLGPYDRENLQD
jgi:hypothetical protein